MCFHGSFNVNVMVPHPSSEENIQFEKARGVDNKATKGVFGD